MIVYEQNDDQSLMLTIFGCPPSQGRPRAKRVGSGLIVYDPSSPIKTLARRVLKKAMTEIGVTSFPHYVGAPKLSLVIDFFVHNMRKDVDNMLKWIFDVLEGVVYQNDVCVVRVVATKIETARHHEKTVIQVKKI